MAEQVHGKGANAQTRSVRVRVNVAIARVDRMRGHRVLDGSAFQNGMEPVASPS